MPRRAALVAAGLALALAACGTPVRSQTLDHEPDLARITNGTVPAGLRGTTAAEVERLRKACPAITATVGGELHGTVSGFDANPPLLYLDDAQCEWMRHGGRPLLIVGIIDGGADRFTETVRALKDERTVDGVGDRAAYDPQTRTLYSLRSDRLWYAQLVGDTPPGSDARLVTTAIARALMHAPATA